MLDTVSQSPILRWLQSEGPIAVAISGGVDSMTLGALAHQVNPKTFLYHAVSPAVPIEATERVKAYGESFHWNLRIIDALEFADENYLKNPVNRCFFCKQNLYSVIQKHTKDTIVSGTNTDDLGDFRPGLKAAKNLGVRHPWAETGYSKQNIREIASAMGLHDISDLPASPCLSSRVETGIPINPQHLPVINKVEVFGGTKLSAGTIRCRIRKTGIVIELDNHTRKTLSQQQTNDLMEFAHTAFSQAGLEGGPPRLANYQMGSAFVGKEAFHE